MGRNRNNRFNSKRQDNFKRKRKLLEIRKDGLKKERFIVFSLRYIDRSQGQTIQKWEEENLLAKAMERFQGLNGMSARDALTTEYLKVYGPGIPSGSRFSHPKHLDEDVHWSSIRIQGRERIIGFLEEDFIFNIVFFDMKHEFYPSKKKNT